MVLARRLLVVCVFVAMLVGGWQLASKNSASVVVNHPAGELGEFKLWVVLGGSFALGVVSTALVSIYRGTRMRLAARRYRKLLANLQSEIHQLRNLPLVEPQRKSAGAPADGLERGS